MLTQNLPPPVYWWRGSNLKSNLYQSIVRVFQSGVDIQIMNQYVIHIKPWGKLDFGKHWFWGFFWSCILIFANGVSQRWASLDATPVTKISERVVAKWWFHPHGKSCDECSLEWHGEKSTSPRQVFEKWVIQHLPHAGLFLILHPNGLRYDASFKDPTYVMKLHLRTAKAISGTMKIGITSPTA
jgi:hypothetical protein